MKTSTVSRLLIALFLASLVVGVTLVFRGGGNSSFRKSKGGTLAVVNIVGPISVRSSNSGWGNDDADAIARKLHRLSENDDVKAILLRINSPGGTVGAVQEIHTELERCRAKGKKIVASLGDVAASGGYYLAAGADEVFADSGTIVGSIGVILQFGNLEGLFQKFGVKLEVIKSGAHKDIGSPARPLTPEERKLLQASIDDAYDQFVTAVAKGRKLPVEQVKPLADGRIFTGRQALDLKLVDALGNRYDAYQRAIKLAGLPDKPNLILDNKRGLSGLLDQLSSKFSGESPLAAVADAMPGPQLEYRWR